MSIIEMLLEIFLTNHQKRKLNNNVQDEEEENANEGCEGFFGGGVAQVSVTVAPLLPALRLQGSCHINASELVNRVRRSTGELHHQIRIGRSCQVHAHLSLGTSGLPM